MQFNKYKNSCMFLKYRSSRDEGVMGVVVGGGLVVGQGIKEKPSQRKGHLAWILKMELRIC